VCERERERREKRERKITYIGIFSEICGEVSAPAAEGSCERERERERECVCG